MMTTCVEYTVVKKVYHLCLLFLENKASDDLIYNPVTCPN